MVKTISNGDDIIDSRDVIARIEELKSERDDDPETFGTEQEPSEEYTELKELEALSEEASGSPDWIHGESLIRDSYFETYAQELAEDIGAVDPQARWPNDCIDWEKAADQLKQDYMSVSYGEVEYWIRA